VSVETAVTVLVGGRVAVPMPVPVADGDGVCEPDELEHDETETSERIAAKAYAIFPDLIFCTLCPHES